MIRKASLVLSLLCFASSAVADTKAWTGAVSNLWSVGANWNGGIAPTDGDALVFPDGASNRSMNNDLSGLDLTSISFTGASSGYSASGNPITLTSGLTTVCCPAHIWNIPTTLNASQTFGG